MKTSMAFPIRFWAVLLAGLLLYQLSTDASADRCKYSKEIDLSLDLSGSEVLAITAAAGELDIRGVSGSDNAVIYGKVCVPKQAWLDEAEVETSSAKRSQISVKLPDSSGDATFRDIAALELQDSSGDIEIENAAGPVSIKDSSGDISVKDVGGDFRVLTDGSGSIRSQDVQGEIQTPKDG